jgi:hypothetical protein
VLTGRQGVVAPYLAPAIFCGQSLEVAIEVIDIPECSVDVRIAQHPTTLGEASFVEIPVHSEVPQLDAVSSKASNAFLVFKAFQMSRTEASGYAL